MIPHTTPRELLEALPSLLRHIVISAPSFVMTVCFAHVEMARLLPEATRYRWLRNQGFGFSYDLGQCGISSAHRGKGWALDSMDAWTRCPDAAFDRARLAHEANTATTTPLQEESEFSLAHLQCSLTDLHRLACTLAKEERSPTFLDLANAVIEEIACLRLDVVRYRWWRGQGFTFSYDDAECGLSTTRWGSGWDFDATEGFAAAADAVIDRAMMHLSSLANPSTRALLYGEASAPTNALPPAPGVDAKAFGAYELETKRRDAGKPEGSTVHTDMLQEAEATDEACPCLACRRARHVPREDEWLPLEATMMIVCALCHNKRCPHSDNHLNPCTESNEPGQPGSRY